MSPKDLAALFLLGALWGASFIFIRVAVDELGPAALMELRVSVAGAALVVYALVLRRSLKMRARWKELLALGALNAAVPFTLIAAAEVHVTASLAAILIAATPMFTAVVSAFWLKEALTARKGVGLLLGMAGVAVVVGWGPIPLTPAVLLSVAALLVAAFFYGVAGVYAKTTFAGTPPVTLATGQQVGAGLVLLPFAAAFPPAGLPSAAAALAVAGLALLSTAVAYLLYFYLIGSVGPTGAVTVTFLAPVFGIIWGVVLLGEPIRVTTLAGCGIVLASIFLIAGIDTGGAEGWRRRRKSPARGGELEEDGPLCRG